MEDKILKKLASRAGKVHSDFDDIPIDASSQYSIIFEAEWKHMQEVSRLRRLSNKRISVASLEASTHSTTDRPSIKKLASHPKLQVLASTLLPTDDLRIDFPNIRRSSPKVQIVDPAEKGAHTRATKRKQHVSIKYKFLDSEDYEVDRAKRAIQRGDMVGASFSKTFSEYENDAITRSTITLYDKWRTSKKDSKLSEGDASSDDSLEQLVMDLHFDPLYRSKTQDESRSEVSTEYLIDSSSESSSGVVDLRSFYDLPILLHKKAILQYGLDPGRSMEALKELGKWQPMISSVQDVRAHSRRSTRFSTLDPMYLIKVLAKRHTFEYVRHLGIRKLQSDTANKLQMISQFHGCQQGIFKAEDLPHKVFSWSEKDFLVRRKLNPIWIDIILKAIEPQCLQALKLQRDVDELNIYIRLLLKGFLGEGKKFDIFQDIIHVIENCMDFLKLFEYLETELMSHTNELQHEMRNVANATLFRLSTSKSIEKERYVRAFQDSSIIDPIEFRYHVGTCISRRENFQDHKKIKIKRIEEEIKRYKQMLNQENHRSQSTLNTYYVQIQLYRAKILTMSRNYDSERDRLHNEAFKMKSGMEKMEMAKSFCVENLERLKFELDLILSAASKSPRIPLSRSRSRRFSAVSIFTIKQMRSGHGIL